MATIDDDLNGYISKASDLLDLWRARLRIYEDGDIIVGPSKMDAAKALVHTLSALDQSEELHIRSERPQAPYIVRRVSNGEVLAEID